MIDPEFLEIEETKIELKETNIEDLLDRLTFDPRCGIVVPWLASGEMCLLYAQRGVGKTFFCMWLAASISLGYKFCGWGVVKSRVLYLDGEMGFKNMQYRFKHIFEALNARPKKENLRLVSYPESGCFPNLSLIDNQKAIDEIAEDYDLIIIDNLFTVANRINSRDDEFRIWERLQPWFISLRERGKCVILVHHSGKSGEQSGTMMKENICDVIVKLSAQKTEEHNGCSFQFQVMKERNFVSDDCPPQVCKLYKDPPRWTHTNLKESRANCINRKLADGWSRNDIAGHLGIPISLVKDLEKLGLNQESNEIVDKREKEQIILFDEF